MRRQVSLEEISDGRLYSPEDLVKTDCGGCKDCSACCHGMGESIILDPYDMMQLCMGTDKTPGELLEEKIVELHVVDGMLLPNLCMEGPEETCSFLDPAGRCRIHRYRPGICRLFPLGRYYPENAGELADTGDRSFFYFLQTGECPKAGKTKIRIRKWLEISQLPQYEQFIADWHSFLQKMEKILASVTDEQQWKNISLYLLKLFFLQPYSQDFYGEFYQRLNKVGQVVES